MNMMEFLKGYSPAMLVKLEQHYGLQGNFVKARLVGEFRETYGKRVKVVRGRKVPLGTVGECFWMGATNYKKYPDYWGIGLVVRIGIRDDAGVVYWTSLRNVEVLPESEQPVKPRVRKLVYTAPIRRRVYEIHTYGAFTPAQEAMREHLNELYAKYDELREETAEKHTAFLELQEQGADASTAQEIWDDAENRLDDLLDELYKLESDFDRYRFDRYRRR